MKNLLIPAILLCIFSCTNSHEGFKIDGRFSNSRGEKIRLCELGVKEITPLDSAYTDPDGQISFRHNTEEPGFYIMIFPDGRRLTIIAKPGDHILLRGDIRKDPAELIVSGSADSELLQFFFRRALANRNRVDSIKSILKNHEGMEDLLKVSITADSVFSIIASDQKSIEQNFINNHPESLASLIVINYSFGPQPVLTMKDDFPYYQKLSGLSKKYPGNKHVIYHIKRVKLNREE